MQQLPIYIKKLYNLSDLPLPKYETNGSAGMDLYAAITDVILIKPSEKALIPTGIAIAMPIGFEAQIRSRSGIAHKHSVIIPNSPGTIDSDYRGEIFVPMLNLGKDNFEITRGMRIAQMIISNYLIANWKEVDELESSKRGEKGFGSTGI